MKALNTISNVIVILLIPFLVLAGIDDALAAKKRSKKKRGRAKRTRVYNPAQTKANAIEKLQSSDELSRLAGVDSNVTHPESKAWQQQDATDTNSTNSRPAAAAAAEEMSDVLRLKTYLGEADDDDESIGDTGEDATELAAEDDIKVDIDKTDFKTLGLLAIGANDATTTSYGTEKEEMMGVIMDGLGTPYRFGGESTKAIDCSAWVRAIFYKSSSVYLPRTAREQVQVGRRVTRNNLEFGDLVFFHTYSKKFASHVGIYLSDDLFAHASSVAGVTISSLNSTYYAKRFIGGRRLSSKDLLTYRIEKESNN